MRISRIYTDQELKPGTGLDLDSQASHHLVRVLKLRAGSPLVLFNGDGCDYAAELVAIGRGGAELAIKARLPAVSESRLHITLVQAICRGERMDYSLQKATELGVTAFQPLITERVEVRLDAKRVSTRMAHWLGIIRSACEQSGRAAIPRLGVPLSLDDWLHQGSDALRLVLDPRAGNSLSGRTFSGERVELLIGPEGGLSNAELERLKRSGIKSLNLGPRILRTETAGPAAVAVLQAIAGDL